MHRLIGLVLLLMMAGCGQAADPAGTQSATKPVAAAEDKQAIALIRERLLQSRDDLPIASISAAGSTGLYKVQLENGPSLYATADGQNFVLGDLFAVTADGFVNVAEQERQQDRAKLMAAVSTSDMVVFAPSASKTKAVVNVFTDVDCFYCQKLHQEVTDLNRIGIEVRYLAFPRAGINSDSYNKIASAWCSKDQQESITRLKNRQSIPIAVCKDNPVAEQYELGKQVGVTGTPALITADGTLLPGYMPALELARRLNVEVDPAIAQELAAKQQAVN